MKVIMFTQRVEVVESYQERRDCADQRVTEFLNVCGYLALPIPNRPEKIKELLHRVKPDGVVLTGGNSLVKYGGNALERDQTDTSLIRLCEEQRLPLYGFCRGMQSILDYYGNELEEVSGHVAKRHTVHGEAGEFEVNSYHNQACTELKKGSALKILSKSEDGVIEAVEHTSYPFLGTMWHPEREASFTERDIEWVRRLFQ